ncbi:DUF2975 domain-containing protein [Cryobacterium sp. PAMC25264]|uniref:DUF2975 domain-containing protein n=1 Tax=Cryobacterium sp. PAMC25264 TaxID=2861288 RepID=UPI0021083907|nr:DUF2975 domain-containing protein [Cryobacterium sp. PAMC25264]
MWSALTALLIVVLCVAVLVQVWVLPAAVATVVATFPVVTPIALPGVIWGVLAIACWQAIAVIGLRLVALAKAHRLEGALRGWLRAIVGCLLVFVLLVAAAVIALNVLEYATPGLMFALLGSGLLAVVAAVAVLLHLGAGPARLV